jgi:hypothetical protein
VSVAAILAAVRPLSPALRHTGWALMTCAMLTMALLTSLVPTMPLPFALPMTVRGESAYARVQAVPRREPPANRRFGAAVPTHTSAPASYRWRPSTPRTMSPSVPRYQRCRPQWLNGM